MKCRGVFLLTKNYVYGKCRVVFLYLGKVLGIKRIRSFICYK